MQNIVSCIRRGSEILSLISGHFAFLFGSHRKECKWEIEPD